MPWRYLMRICDGIGEIAEIVIGSLRKRRDADGGRRIRGVEGIGGGILRRRADLSSESRRGKRDLLIMLLVELILSLL